MTAEPTTIEIVVPPGPRYALRACALALGTSRGPALILSAIPRWERALRTRIGDQLFTLDDPSRPPPHAWTAAVWLEPQWRTWRTELEQIRNELPPGGQLTIVLSLPLASLQRSTNCGALGMIPSGIGQLRAALADHGFTLERAFGFQTLWSSALGWLAIHARSHRPDWSDRLHYVAWRFFTTKGLGLSLAATGLLEARAGMRP